MAHSGLSRLLIRVFTSVISGHLTLKELILEHNLFTATMHIKQKPCRPYISFHVYLSVIFLTHCYNNRIKHNFATQSKFNHDFILFLTSEDRQLYV